MKNFRIESQVIVGLFGIIFVISGVLTQFIIETKVNAQSCAPVSVTTGTGAAWYQGTSSSSTVVWVYIVPSESWNSNKINAIKAAFTNWEGL